MSNLHVDKNVLCWAVLQCVIVFHCVKSVMCKFVALYSFFRHQVLLCQPGWRLIHRVTEKQLEERFSAAKTITGTQKIASLCTQWQDHSESLWSLTEFHLSSCNSMLSEGGESSWKFGNVDCTEILPGSTYVACQYDRKWWIGLVKEKSE